MLCFFVNGTRSQVEAGEISVLPQRRDRVGHVLAAAYCRNDDACGVVDRELVQQGCGELVEQVRVVDTEHERTVREQRVAGGGQDQNRVAQCSGADEMAECAERDAACRFRARHPPHAAVHGVDHAAGKRGLADPGGPGQQHPASDSASRPQRGSNRIELALPFDEWPGPCYTCHVPSLIGHAADYWVSCSSPSESADEVVLAGKA